MIPKKIFVVEDSESMRMGIVESLRRDGYMVTDFAEGLSALKALEKQEIPLIITDLKMEPIDGIEVLKRVKAINNLCEVILISAYGSIDTAVKAMQIGAADFLTKPFSTEELKMRVGKIWDRIEYSRQMENLIEQNRLLHEEISTAYKDIVGNSSLMQSVYKTINQVADKGSSLLIYGESGTGKELIARAVHRQSNRASQPFIKINCGALNDNLLESELFGHEKGAFTGAIRRKQGRFELADKGTLFLDEIGDISNAMQIKLLRVLQEGEFERVGGEETISTDIRIIAATNRDLQKMIAENSFRDDLYYRISVIPIFLPPLRERREDIPALVAHFSTKIAQNYGQEVKQFTPEAVQMLLEYNWPGNIRELENLVERLFVISQGSKIDTSIVAAHISKGVLHPATTITLDKALFNFEKNLITQAMKEAKGVKNKAARILGVKTSALYYKLEKFDLLKD